MIQAEARTSAKSGAFSTSSRLRATRRAPSKRPSGQTSSSSNTQGNVTSNGQTRTGHIRQDFIMNHEYLHVTQSRIFGPLFQLVYVVWFAGGTVVGFVVWLFDREVSLTGLIQTAGYYDNPFEYWAYRNDDHWRPGGVIAKLAWPDAS